MGASWMCAFLGEGRGRGGGRERERQHACVRGRVGEGERMRETERQRERERERERVSLVQHGNDLFFAESPAFLERETDRKRRTNRSEEVV